MAKINTSITEFCCDKYISITYFGGIGVFCSEQILQDKIAQLMGDLKDKYLYIGVTHHPCSRFCGNKKETNPLPLSLNFTYKIDERIELINESAHYLEYDKMYLICYANTKENVFKNEQNAIRIAKTINDKKVLNLTQGGNGNLANSEFYWLYICTRDKKILS